MPIYEYKCQQCGLHVEKRQSVSEAPLTACEKCHGKLEKQWSLSGFQFKGAGWYVTDYGAQKGNTKDAAEKSSDGQSTANPEIASNEKPEPKAAPVKEAASKPAKE